MKIGPVKAIRVRCLDCGGGSPKAVRLCENNHCSLYPFRMGKNPNRKGIGGRKQRSFAKG